MLSLPDLDPDVGQEIVGDNIRAVQAIYFASQLENMRAFEVAERLLQLFQQGLLPLSRRGRGQRLLHSMATADSRLSMRERRSLYARALGAPSGARSHLGGHRDFHFAWLRFVARVALLEQQAGSATPTDRGAVASSRLRSAAIALAASASARGAGLSPAAHRLAVDANRLRALFEATDIQNAFGARDMWQVIEQVSAAELGGAVNVARYRARAVASSSVLQWLADHAHALKLPSAPAGAPSVLAPALFAAVDQWLASSGVIDEGFGSTVKPPVSPSRKLAGMGDRLHDELGLDAVAGRPRKVIALLCGPAGTGKSLAAHALTERLARELMRVDLRQVVSKFIGETEKNLAAVLDQVEYSGAVLLLDEADALFGKRTTVQDAHDRYAGLEIGTLARRLAAASDLVIFECRHLPPPTALQETRVLDPVIRFPLRPASSR